MSKTIYGIHAVNALLTFKPQHVQALYIQKSRSDQALDTLIDLAESEKVAVEKVNKSYLDELFAEKVVHQGVAAKCSQLPVYQEADVVELLQFANEPRLVLLLDGVQDPHNLGACMRVANALGVCAVMAPKKNAAGLTAAAIKVSTGAAFATPFVQVTNLARSMRELQAQGFWLVGASTNATTELKDIDMQGDIGIVMGAEGTGLRALTEKTCDFLARIPMVGSVSSLNVSVATGITLYEVFRQRES